MTSEKIEILVRIIKYLKDDVRVEYENRSNDSFDATIAQVIEPQTGLKEVYFYHSKPILKNSPWRDIGKICRILVERDVIYPSWIAQLSSDEVIFK